MTKQTMIEQLKARQRDMTDRVAATTGLSPEQIMNMMFEMGAQYIEAMAGGENLSRAFLKEPLFWAWWRQQWSLLDEQFLHQVNDHLSRHQKSIVYKRVHERLDTYPDPVIWDKIHSAYQQMSQQVIAKSKSKVDKP